MGTFKELIRIRKTDMDSFAIRRNVSQILRFISKGSGEKIIFMVVVMSLGTSKKILLFGFSISFSSEDGTLVRLNFRGNPLCSNLTF